MSKLFIRVKKDGFIYEYNEIMAANPSCEVIPEELAYPERFIPPEAAQRVEMLKNLPEPDPEPEVKKKAAPGRPRKVALDLSTSDIPEPPPYTRPELAAQAAQGFPK